MKSVFKLFSSLATIFILASQIKAEELDVSISEEQNVETSIETKNAQSENTETEQETEDSLLKPSPTITITSIPLDPSLLEYGQAVSVINKEDLSRKAQVSIGETLRNETGVSSSYYGPGSSRPVIRGNAGERVRILRNGVGSLDVSNTAEDHQVSINPLSAESIEILRGPETLLYGSSAIGGVVNVVDGIIPSKEIGEDFQGEYNLRTDTVSDEKLGALKLEGQIGSINWRVSGLSQETNDIEIPGIARSQRLRDQEGAVNEMGQTRDRLPNSDTLTRNGSLGLSHVWDKGYVGLAITGYGSRYGVPGEMDPPDPFADQASSPDRVFIEMEQWRLDTRGEIQEVSQGIDKIRFTGAVSNYDHKEVLESETQSKFSNDAFEGRAELFHAPLKDFSGRIGSQFEYSEFSAIGDQVFVPSSRRLAPGIFIFEEKPILGDEVKALFGARVEMVDISPVGEEYRARTFAPLSFSSGLSWDITGREDYVAGLSLAYTERAPAATELYADGIHFGRRIAERGIDNLTNENSVGIDLTLKKNTGLVTGGLALFAQEYGNYINLASTGREIEGFNEFSYKETRARFLGAEIESTLHIDRLFDLYSNLVELGVQFDYTRARDTRFSEDLPRIPPLKTLVTARYGWRDYFTSSLEGLFVAAQREIGSGELPTDAYQMLNANLDIHIPYLTEKDMMLYARGVNLTDQEARIHSSFIKDLAPLPGRSFILGLRGTF